MIVLPEEFVLHKDALGKVDLVEWAEVPLGTRGIPIGVLSVDLKGQEGSSAWRTRKC